MLEEPIESAVAKPFALAALLIGATSDLEEYQVTRFVISCSEPSIKVPIALNCWVNPLAIELEEGLIVILFSFKSVTVIGIGELWMNL